MGLLQWRSCTSYQGVLQRSRTMADPAVVHGLPVLDGSRLRGHRSGTTPPLLAMARGSAVVCIGEAEPMGWEASIDAAGRVGATWRAILHLDREITTVNREKNAMYRVI